MKRRQMERAKRPAINVYEEIQMFTDNIKVSRLGFTRCNTLVLCRSLFLAVFGYLSIALAGAQNVTPVSWWSADIGFNDALGNNPGRAVGSVSFVPGIQNGQAFHFDGSGYILVKNN